MNKERVNEYINQCKVLIAQGEFLINSQDSLREEDINIYFKLFEELIDDLKEDKQISGLIIDKLDSIFKAKSYMPSNKLLYNIQLFFLDWYCGIIGDDKKLIAFKTSTLSMYINDIREQLNGIIYYLEKVTKHKYP